MALSGPRVIYLVAALCLSLGCTSISSTALNRTESDQLYGNSNGDSKAHNKARPFKGVPITVRVPTHVDIAVMEKVLIDVSGLARIQTPHRNLFVESKLVYTGKVFTVDIKRPGAGTLDYTMEFGDNVNGLDNSQYFKNLKSKIDDQTLEDISAAIGSVTRAMSTSNEGAAPKSQEIVAEVRTVAWKRFDIDSPDFEFQITEFLNRHLNECHHCKGLGQAAPANAHQHHSPTQFMHPAQVHPH